MIFRQFKYFAFKQFNMKQIWLLPSGLRRISSDQGCHMHLASASINDQKTNIPVPLPVQPLQQMLQKYLRSVSPFTNSTELESTKAAIESLLKKNGIGERLQKLLEERAKTTNNWLSDWWLDTAYLSYRDPVVIFSSPGLVWPHTSFQNLNDQLIYTTNVIMAALQFNEKVERGDIPQEKSGPDPLCMLQYNKIFGTHRIPSKPKDLLQIQNLENASRNIIVLYNNFLFTLDVFEEGSRKPVNAEQMYAMLKDVVEQGTGEPGPAIGVLTSENRDIWADAYEQLKKDSENKRNLEEYVERALFVVCIDKPLKIGGELHHSTRCSRLLLHGFGGSGNGGNRWFDKTLQFIIGAGEDGVGIAYEHSPAEGGPIGVLTDFVQSFLKTAPKEMESSNNFVRPKKLSFSLTESIAASILVAGKKLDSLNEDLEVIGFTFPYFGKNRLKAAKMSPDSFIQIAIQYAFYKTHNQPSAQYESGTLRKFTEGRTDVIRTCSTEAVDFCKTMCDKLSSRNEKIEALKKAIKAHKDYAVDVINGRGVDRHLLGLKILAKANNIEEPLLFSDKSYNRSTYFQLSTSNVPTKCDGFMVYGPLVKDGYACCYNPRDDSINFGTSAWRSCSYTHLNYFVSNLKQALLDMEACLSDTPLTSKL